MGERLRGSDFGKVCFFPKRPLGCQGTVSVQNEVGTGEYIKYLGGHPEKAANAITFLQDLINSGQLSGSDQMIAGYLISDLKNALGK